MGRFAKDVFMIIGVQTSREFACQILCKSCVEIGVHLFGGEYGFETILAGPEVDPTFLLLLYR